MGEENDFAGRGKAVFMTLYELYITHIALSDGLGWP
jgi:hypothetical protein